MAKAMAETRIYVDPYVAWCHDNDKTLINGSKIYTGSITAEQIAADAVTSAKIEAGAVTADKISVTSLEAIVAKIGGFTIGNDAIYNGTESLLASSDGVYVGIDGIRCGPDFVVDSKGLLRANTANLQDLALFGSVVFFEIEGYISGSGHTIVEQAGGISVGDRTDYTWSLTDPATQGYCLEYFGPSRFNSNVSMKSLYVDNELAGNSLYIGKQHVADYVVEEGTSGNWTYRKYASGTFDAWLRQSGPTLSSWTASGNMYYGDVITINFPFTVVSNTGVASITLNHQCMASNLVVGTASLNFRPMRGQSSNITALVIYTVLHGRWK